MPVRTPLCGVLPFLLVACGGSQAAVGVYDLDRAALAALVRQVTKGAGGALAQQVVEAASGTIELRADGSMSLQMSLGIARRATGTWRRDSEGILLVTRDEQGREQRIGCGYDGRSIAMKEIGPGGVELQLVWHRR